MTQTYLRRICAGLSIRARARTGSTTMPPVGVRFALPAASHL